MRHVISRTASAENLEIEVGCHADTRVDGGQALESLDKLEPLRVQEFVEADRIREMRPDSWPVEAGILVPDIKFVCHCVFVTPYWLCVVRKKKGGGVMPPQPVQPSCAYVVRAVWTYTFLGDLYTAAPQKLT